MISTRRRTGTRPLHSTSIDRWNQSPNAASRARTPSAAAAAACPSSGPPTAARVSGSTDRPPLRVTGTGRASTIAHSRSVQACASTCSQPPASARSTRAAKNERSSKPHVYQRMSGCERSVGAVCRHAEASSISGDGVRRVGSSVSGRSLPVASRARSTLSIA